MDYEKKYKDALERAKIELNADTTQGTKNVLMTVFPELKESEDERIRKALIDYFDDANKADENCLQSYGTNIDKVISWLEKQKEIDKEIVFRPLAGTDIIAAAKQALEKIEIGKEVILAFNGAYIHVNGKTVAEICNEYFAWTENRGQKSTWSEEDERLRNSCIKHIEEELEEIRKDKFGHSEIISDLKESCRERINWLKSLKKDWFEKQGEQKLKE